MADQKISPKQIASPGGTSNFLRADGTWTQLVWGNITGTLANQTDLQNALNAKLNATGGNVIGGNQQFNNLVGIGAAPAANYQLSVTNTASSSRTLLLNGGGQGTISAPQLDFNDGVKSGSLWVNTNEVGLGSYSNLDLVLYRNQVEGLRITTTGTAIAGALSSSNLVTVKLASTANFTNTSPTTTVLTASATGTTTIDGTVLASGYRVLLKDQTNPEENGVYQVTTAGATGVATVLTRVGELNSWSNILTNPDVTVQSGVVNGGSIWLSTTTLSSGVLGTDPINFRAVAIKNITPTSAGLTVGGTIKVQKDSGTVDLYQADGTTWNGGLAGASSTLTVTGGTGGLILDTTSSGVLVFKYAGTEVARADGTGFKVSKQILGTASTTSAASLNIPHGTSPSSPVNGDIWTTTGGVFARLNGATASFSGTNTGDQTSVSGQAGYVANSITWNNSGAGTASGSTFNGSAPVTVSYNTIGAAPTAYPEFSGGVRVSGTNPYFILNGDGSSYYPTLQFNGASFDTGTNATIEGYFGLRHDVPVNRSHSFAVAGQVLLTVDGSGVSFGPSSGAVADSVTYQNNTNAYNFWYFRRWASGVPTTQGFLQVGDTGVYWHGAAHILRKLDGTNLVLTDATGVNATVPFYTQSSGGAGIKMYDDADAGYIQSYNLKPLRLNWQGNDVALPGTTFTGSNGNVAFTGILTAARDNAQSRYMLTAGDKGWRIIHSATGTTGGSLILQYSTDTFAANFTNALTLNNDGTGSTGGSFTIAGTTVSQGYGVFRGGGAGAEGGQLVLGYGNNVATAITAQANNTWNIDIDATNNFRIFRQNASGVTATGLTIAEATGDITFAHNVTATGTINGLTLKKPTTNGIGIGDTNTLAAATGDFTIAIGNGAAQALSTGVRSIAIGHQALNAETTANYQVAIGWRSLFTANGAGYNVGLGYSTLTLLTTGQGNVALGYNVLSSVTTDNYHVGIGRSVLENVAGATLPNVMIGAFSGRNITTGANVGVGYNTLGTETTGSQNTAVGHSAGATQNGASNSAFFGYQAGLSATTGIQNTLVGSLAGRDITTGASNVVLGYNTGRGITTGGGNTIIGPNVTALAAGLTNNIMLANGAGVMAWHDGTNWTLTGGLNVVGNLMGMTAPAGNDALSYTSAPQGQTAYHAFRKNGLNRFSLQIDPGTESGSNAASNFFIGRYNDAGSWIDNPFTITRSTGDGTYYHNFTVNGGILTVDVIAGGQAVINFRRAGVNHWGILMDGSTESGSNVGGDFYIARHTDAGAWIDNPFSIQRSSGNASFTHNLSVTGTMATGNILMSGNQVVAIGAADGGTEIGNYLDFHVPNIGDGTDFKARIQANSSGDITIDPTSDVAYLWATQFYLGGGTANLMLQHDGSNAFIRTTSGKGNLFLGANGTNWGSINGTTGFWSMGPNFGTAEDALHVRA
jgi:hypothetical protein